MRLALLAAAALALGAGAPVQPPSPAVRAPGPGAAADSDPLRVPFMAGERLEYQVKFGIFRVGHAEMEVLGIDTIRGVPTWHVRFAVHGSAIFYSMTDTLESWFSVYDLSSRRFVQNNNEDGHLYQHTYEIFPDRGFFIQDDRDTLPTTAQPLDDMSFFYFARTVPLDTGQTYEYERYFRPDRNPVTLSVLGDESVNVPAGRFDAIVVRPVFKSRGMFAAGGRAQVYLAADSTRIPLLIKSWMSVGYLTISLRNRRQP
jgi:hypothetical protein